MELLHGETLHQRVKDKDKDNDKDRDGGRLELAEVLHISWQVASALVAAHERGIAHRDLKPENIMLVADALSPSGERAKLLDFGIAEGSFEAERQAGVPRPTRMISAYWQYAFQRTGSTHFDVPEVRRNGTASGPPGAGRGRC